MAMWLRYATASQEICIGRFVDSSDGNTEKTALSIANTDIKLFKNGATSLVSKNSGGATHMANGLYYTVMDGTDTDTLGLLEVHAHVSGALPIMRQFMVVPVDVYDAIVAGLVYLPVNGFATKFTLSGSTLTTKKVDGSTTHFTRTVTTDGTADPVTGSTT